jgi:hypothetical protein
MPAMLAVPAASVSPPNSSGRLRQPKANVKMAASPMFAGPATG